MIAPVEYKYSFNQSQESVHDDDNEEDDDEGGGNDDGDDDNEDGDSDDDEDDALPAVGVRLFEIRMGVLATSASLTPLASICPPPRRSAVHQ